MEVFGILFECLLSAFQVIFGFLCVIIKWTWPLLTIFFGVSIIKSVVSGGADTDDTYSSSSASSSSSYDNQNIFGVSHGNSSCSNGKADHTDFWGTATGSSEIKGDKIQHKTWYGEYSGVSKLSSDGKRIEHYSDINEGYLYKGYSDIKENGDIVHHDALGTETGISKKK